MKAEDKPSHHPISTSMIAKVVPLRAQLAELQGKSTPTERPRVRGRQGRSHHTC